MALHHYDNVAAKAARQIAALQHSRHQQVGLIADMVGNVPHQDLGSHVTAGVDDRPQRRGRDGEGQHIFGMGVHARVNVRARFIDRAVNKSFEIQRATVVADRIAVSGRVACPRL